jgi:hypothetical protein
MGAVWGVPLVEDQCYFLKGNIEQFNIPPDETNEQKVRREHYTNIHCHAGEDLGLEELRFIRNLIIIINPTTNVRLCFTIEDLQRFTREQLLNFPNLQIYRLPNGFTYVNKSLDIILNGEYNTFVLYNPKQALYHGQNVNVYSISAIPRRLAFDDVNAYQFEVNVDTRERLEEREPEILLPQNRPVLVRQNEPVLMVQNEEDWQVHFQQGERIRVNGGNFAVIFHRENGVVYAINDDDERDQQIITEEEFNEFIQRWPEAEIHIVR